MSSSERRFFSNTAITPFTRQTLDGPEHQHLAKVLRAKPGDQVVLFDGGGSEFEATIESVGRSSTELSVGSGRTIDRELPFQLSLAVALPKGDRQQWLVEKAVEIGVTQLIPLQTDLGVAQPSDNAMQRLRRWTIAASKQSGRNRLMGISRPTPLQELTSLHSQSTILIAHPYDGKELGQLMATTCQQHDKIVAIGPEGGFSKREIELADSEHCQIVSLGPRILRIETAAVALASALIYAYRP